MDFCVSVGDSEVLHERTAAFWMFVSRPVPQTSCLNGLQRFSCCFLWSVNQTFGCSYCSVLDVCITIIYDRCSRHSCCTDPSVFDFRVPVSASDVLVEFTAAFWMSVLRSVPQTLWLNAPQPFSIFVFRLVPQTFLVERTTAFWMSVLRSVPQASCLNGPQTFGFVCSGRCLRRFG